jgi:hypothetical protein
MTMDNSTLTKHAEAILRAAGMSDGAIMLVLDAGPVSSEAILTALRAAVEDGAPRWRGIESAPYSTPVRIKCGGMTFIAELLKDVGMTEDEDRCDGWQAVNEGEHPPCWSGGMCWSSNENEDPSIPPEAWQPLADHPLTSNPVDDSQPRF